MKEPLSVSKAINLGNLWVNGGIFLLLFGPSLLVFVLLKIQSGTIVAPVLIASFVLAWLYWSLVIPRWKLWAYPRVEDWLELERSAIAARLIWPPGNWFNKIEIWTAAMRSRFEEIKSRKWVVEVEKQAKEAARPILDDPSIPKEVIYRHPIRDNVLIAGFGLAGILGAVYFIPETGHRKYLLMAITSFLFVYGMVRILNRKPQLILNDRGIQTAKAPFHSWKDIRQEQVQRVLSGQNIFNYLVYAHPGGQAQIELGELGLKPKDVEKMLKVYRIRSQKLARFR